MRARVCAREHLPVLRVSLVVTAYFVRCLWPLANNKIRPSERYAPTEANSQHSVSVHEERPTTAETEDDVRYVSSVRNTLFLSLFGGPLHLPVHRHNDHFEVDLSDRHC